MTGNESIGNIESREIPLPPIGFEDYRTLCDETSGSYRKVGVIDAEKYEDALEDPTTEFVDLNGRRIPLIVSGAHIDGFDIERTKKLTGKGDIFMLAVPVESLHEPVVIKNDYSGAAILVETDSKITYSAKAGLPGLLEAERPLEVLDFTDPRIDDEDHRDAWLALYKGDVEVIDASTEKKTLEQAFLDDGGEIAPENGYTLLSGTTLKEHPEIIDQLWELFEDRFGWLGDYHPVSMEDTREWFDSFLTHPDTNTLIRYVDGEQKCAGFYQLKPESCEWLNARVMDEVVDNSSGRVHAFLAALAATVDNLGAYSEDYVKFQCRIAALAGMDYEISMESSNMSSTYMPRIMAGYMSNSGHAKVTIREVSRTDYWYLATS